MCGRYTIVDGTVKIFSEVLPVLTERWELIPRYNIAPSQKVPIVHQTEKGPIGEMMRWGLIPFWAKDASIGFRMINARAESVAEKPAFRNSMRHRRCLIPADGFYEWKGKGKAKRPYHIHFKSKTPFCFAGLWDQWDQGEGKLLKTFTIITTTTNEVTSAIHDRMPVILHRSAYQNWISDQNQDLESLLALLKPYPAEEMEAYEVEPLVNSPRNDRPECILPRRPAPDLFPDV
jgi:putative SOS response-associated peptidase YedK